MIRKSVLALALVAASALPALAKDDALSLVPTNAVTVGVVKLRDMRTSPLSSMLFQQTDKFSTDGDAAKFLTDAGLDPAKDVDFVVVATSPRTNLGTEADVLVAAEGRFNPERLTNALIARGAVKKNGYLLTPEKNDDGDTGAVAFPTSQLAIAGTERAVAAALAARANGGTGFPAASGFNLDLARIDANATAWALVDVVRAARLTSAPKMQTGRGQSGEALAAAIRSVSTVALWATDSGDALKVGGIGFSNDTETLGLLEDTIRGALSAMRLAVKDKSPELVTVLRRFDVSRNDTSVTITGSIPASSLRSLMAKKTASR
ncbi:MAG TPA: hypothetical protein VFN10_08365 [Thermoanaerobaculia bacterium]|nr:hypothetical protein [Thermoanaerobaculia bacterium]